MKYSQAQSRHYTYQCITPNCSSMIGSNESLDKDPYCTKCTAKHTREMLDLQGRKAYAEETRRVRSLVYQKRIRNNASKK